ncbi:MAG: 3-dehydroquinate synthase, partial [Planctomycetaceae bacterium]|nr:3-dehydroquinate synthase [Planctomycetaceae bacterium]
MLREWTGRKSYLSSEPGQMLLVTDENVARLFANEIAELCRKAGWNVVMEILPAGEKTKSQEQTTRLYDRLVDMRADRRTLVLAVGGGVIGDLAGFVAASYARGLPFVQCPTTLLAAVDSSVGGKVGINHPRGKNLIGAFHQPLGVFIDTSAIVTLPERDYRSGLAEIVKYGVILDESLFEKLEQQVAAIQKREPEILT